MNSQKRIAIVVLVASSAAIGCIGVASAQSRVPTGDRWEYAEFTQVGDKAYLTTQDRRTGLEPPSSMPSSYTTDNDRVLVGLNVKILHLNKLGAEGWEFVAVQNVADGATYLLRRRR